MQVGRVKKPAMRRIILGKDGRKRALVFRSVSRKGYDSARDYLAALKLPDWQIQKIVGNNTELVFKHVPLWVKSFGAQGVKKLEKITVSTLDGRVLCRIKTVEEKHGEDPSHFRIIKLEMSPTVIAEKTVRKKQG